MNKLRNAVSKFDADIQKEAIEIRGELGTLVRGKKVVKVPNRPSYVYVRLRTNQSEVIQAFNDKVSLEFGLPVVLSWSHSKYVVLRRDVDRYKTWEEGSNYVPVHAKSHSFDLESGNVGRDPVWVYPSQIIPALVSPFGVQGSENVYIFPYSYNHNNEWRYAGNTGTPSIIDYKSDNGTSLVLVALDIETGNPELINYSGFIPTTISGSAGFAQYIPEVDTSKYLPLSFVTMVSGTNTIGWQNIHDLRPFLGGGGKVSVNDIQVVTNVNFPGASVYFSGSNAFVEFQSASGGGESDSTLFYSEGRLATGTNVSNMYMITQPTTIDQIGLYVNYLGTSGTTTVDVNLIRSGTSSSIFTTQSNRPTLQYNSSTGWILATPDVNEFGAGDVLSLDIDSVSYLSKSLVVSKLITGSSSSGGGLYVTDGTTSVGGVSTLTVGDGLTVGSGGAGNAILSVAVGSVVSIIPIQTRTQAQYTALTTGDGVAIHELDVTITPKKSGNKIILEWVINFEATEDMVFTVLRNGTLLANSDDGGSHKWSGIAAVPYDQNLDSTPSNVTVKIVDESSLDVVTTYSLAVKSTGSSSADLWLNRTYGRAGEQSYENMLSYGQAMEINT